MLVSYVAELRHQEAAVVPLGLVDGDGRAARGDECQRGDGAEATENDCEGSPCTEVLCARLRLRHRLGVGGGGRDGHAGGIVFTGVEPERRILASHERRVGADAEHPTVEAEHEVEDRSRVCAADEQRRHCEEHEQVDQPDPDRPRGVRTDLPRQGPGAAKCGDEVLQDTREPPPISGGPCRSVPE